MRLVPRALPCGGQQVPTVKLLECKMPKRADCESAPHRFGISVLWGILAC